MKEPTAEQPFPKIEAIAKPWPSREEYDEFKSRTIKSLRSKYSDFLRNNPQLFADDPSYKPTDEELDRVGILCSHFIFGVNMVFEKLGIPHKHRMLDINLATNSILRLTGDVALPIPIVLIMNKEGQFEYNIDLYFLISLIRYSAGKDRPLLLQFKIPDEVAKNFRLEDFFELGGVEEAAHYLFHRYKQEYSKRKTDQRPFKDKDYAATDVEAAAITWKKSYIRAYKPDLLPYIEQYERQIREIRREFYSRKTR